MTEESKQQPSRQLINAHVLSRIPLFIQIFSRENQLGIATGFTYTKGGQNFLITNWHNVTGRNPASDKLINSELMEPTSLAIWFHTKINEEELTWKPIQYQLHNKAGKPQWLEHPTYGSSVDVVAIPLTLPEEIELFPINETNFSDFRIQVSQDVFVLGFPRGITGSGKLPIWKRGSIASEPTANLDGLPKCLIDTATREGMSGAPVFVRFTGIYMKDPKKLAADDWLGQGDQFLGIYSGRIIERTDELAAQLGIVWKAQVIDEILSTVVKDS
ncbi:MAG: trypsin-like peptidase domain-containing protein [Anaerolineales bacterium]|nr:trypsin-like peptidase domain-containing protein [Anaerolineales bacterium]